MEKIPNTSRTASTNRAATAPLSEQTLAAFEKSQPAKHVMVKRLIYALRNAWADIAGAEDDLRRLRAAPKIEPAPKVLAVVHPDGWIEIYAEESVGVKVVELTALDSDDECDLQDRLPYSLKYLLNRTPRATGYPNYLTRPNQYTDESAARALLHIRRASVFERIAEWAKSRVGHETNQQ